MSELPGRVRRAFADHDAFESAGPAAFASTTTPFDARVTVEGVTDGRVAFRVELRVPTLSAAVDGHVASVVEEGWRETFELRVADADGVTRGDHGLTPSVERVGEELVATATYEDVDERRGVEDAAALVTFVEGTYVQGIIPGYDYTDPVASLLSSARDAGGF
jgi:hypothetical protein